MTRPQRFSLRERLAAMARALTTPTRELSAGSAGTNSHAPMAESSAEVRGLTMFEVHDADGLVVDVCDTRENAIVQARQVFGSKVLNGTTNAVVWSSAAAAPASPAPSPSPSPVPAPEGPATTEPEATGRAIRSLFGGPPTQPPAPEPAPAPPEPVPAASGTDYVAVADQHAAAADAADDDGDDEGEEVIDDGASWQIAGIAAMLLGPSVRDPALIRGLARPGIVEEAVRVAARIQAVAAVVAQRGLHLPEAYTSSPNGGLDRTPADAPDAAGLGTLPRAPAVHVDDRGNARPYRMEQVAGRTVVRT